MDLDYSDLIYVFGWLHLTESFVLCVVTRKTLLLFPEPSATLWTKKKLDYCYILRFFITVWTDLLHHFVKLLDTRYTGVSKIYVFISRGNNVITYW